MRGDMVSDMTAITGLCHATAMARDYDGLLGPLQRLFGAVVMHDHVSEDPAVGRRGGMVWLGDNSIEIGAPAGDRSPVRRFVDEWGGGMHSLALSVDDAATARERLAGLGVEPVATVSGDIFFTRPGDTAGILLEWSAMLTDDDPRAGARLAPLSSPPVVDVEQYAFVSGIVADPAAVASRLAQLFGTEVVRLVPEAPPDRIAAIVSLVDCLLVLFPMPPADTARRLWGREVTRPRLHGHGLRVADLGAARAALTTEGIDAVAEVDGLVLLDPSALPIPTFLCEQLLPEDPRS
jgi:hypothetical protein